MTIYGVSRVTVRNAIKQLVDENILIKRHGKGHLFQCHPMLRA